MDETTDENKNQVFFYDNLRNSPISQMGLDNKWLMFGIMIIKFGKMQNFSWKVRKHKRAHQVENDLVRNLFTCLLIKKEMLVK